MASVSGAQQKKSKKTMQSGGTLMHAAVNIVVLNI